MKDFGLWCHGKDVFNFEYVCTNQIESMPSLWKSMKMTGFSVTWNAWLIIAAKSTNVNNRCMMCRTLITGINNLSIYYKIIQWWKWQNVCKSSNTFKGKVQNEFNENI